MTDLPTLKSLISRVAAVSEPPFNIEREIANALDPEWASRDLLPPAYLRSIDAAVALIERALPGWQINMKIYGMPGVQDEACIGSSISGTWHKANSTELALILALLSALIAKAEASAAVVDHAADSANDGQKPHD